MRLENYITEVDENYGAVEFLRDRANKKFIEELVTADRFLYRGTEKNIGNFMEMGTSERAGRTPKAMGLNHHDNFNIAFKEKFGWNVRDGVFAIGNKDESYTHGTPHLFFPTSDYKFVWSKDVEDLNYYLDKKYMVKSGAMKIVREITTRDVFAIVDKYTDDNLVKAIKSGNEISFSCKTFVLVNRRLEYKIREEFNIGE